MGRLPHVISPASGSFFNLFLNSAVTATPLRPCRNFPTTTTRVHVNDCEIWCPQVNVTYSNAAGSANNEPHALFIIKTEASLVISSEMDSLKICIQIELVPYWLKIERRTNVILPTHYGNIEKWISRFHITRGPMKYGASVICEERCL